MSKFAAALTSGDAFTENGAITNSTSSSSLVDFFFNAGAIRGSQGKGRNVNYDYLIKLFEKAWSDNPTYVVKNLFYMRDIRQGQGEREAFRQCLRHIAFDKSKLPLFKRNIQFIPEYGRWDDLFCLFGTEAEHLALSLIKEGLDSGNGLCAKWMPRKGDNAIKIRNFLNLTPKQYRKKIVSLSKTVEQQMCSKNWKDIVYSHVPSIASKNYQNAFNRHDMERYQKYLSDVLEKKSKMNASSIYPHEVVKGTDRNAILAQWQNLPDFMEGSENKNILPMCDVSGSMYGLPMDVCTALGAYLSERNKGPFKDHVITFTDIPKFILCSQKHPLDKITEIKRHVGYSTNIMSAFRLILEKAKNASLSQEDMPSMILVLSDMQFNPGMSNLSTFDDIKRLYTKHGYKIPSLVWWNLAAVKDSCPVKSYDDNTALVSGFSPSIMKSILKVKNITPAKVCFNTLNSPRYNNIYV